MKFEPVNHERLAEEIVDSVRDIARRSKCSEEMLIDSMIGAVTACISIRRGSDATIIVLLETATQLMRRNSQLN